MHDAHTHLTVCHMLSIPEQTLLGGQQHCCSR